jgi:PAS domain S-box-containing protein
VPPRASSLLLPPIATALAYAAVGTIALWLAIPPGYASPLYPSAGIALAATLVYGRRVLPGVWLGSWLVNALATALHGPGGWTTALLLPAATGIGAVLQAAVAAELVRRWVGRPASSGPGVALTLSEPRDVARFLLLGAPVACVISATIATLTLVRAGAVPEAGALFTWWTWWAGDTLGTLIGAPIVLTLIGRPRADWAPRRFTVGLSMLLVTALLATAIAQVARWDEQRARTMFDRDAASTSDRVAAATREPLYALEALRSAYLASDHVTRNEFRRAALPWLAQMPHLLALGHSQHVPRAQVTAFEAEVRAEARLPDFRVFDRRDGGGDARARGDADAVVLRYIEPMNGNEGALGVNALSIPAARGAILSARRTGRPTASAAFRLTQDLGDQTGVVVYQALYRGLPATDAERDAAFTGVLFATMRTEEAVQALMSSAPAYLGWCLVDTANGAPRPRLSGARDCEDVRDDGRFAHRRPIAFAGRQWELRLWARAAEVPDVRHWNAWLFSIVGLVATSMLGALLLTVTGRTRRIEVAVADRTIDLEREVGERTRTETALRESEQRVRSIIDNVPIGVMETDLEGRIRQANPKLREMVGYTGADLATMTSANLTHPDDRAADEELLARLLDGQTAIVRRQKRYVTRDRKTLWVMSVTTVLRDANGQPQRLVGVVEDITEHLRLQEAERARESAEAANRAKSEFVSRMSHELRTPLNAMLGFAQLLDLDRQPALAAHQLEWTSQIQHAGWHLLHMIDDTLDLSRIESGALKLVLEPIDLSGVLRATRSLLEQAAQRRRVVVSEHLDPRAEAVLGDETRVKQILTNLLSNAIKYNVEGGRVHVTSRLADPQTVEIEVSDTGLGMTAEQMAELFKPFNRLGREQTGEEGTGIGLVISQRLAELMGGTLRVRSIAGEGSSFLLRLPRSDAPAGRSLDDPHARLEPTYRQRVVHYIEDNETNAEVMRGILLQRPQVKLEVSATGLDGLAAIRQRPPSLVLLDMHLPDIDGLELLRHLARDDATADIPVVVVSADATMSRVEEALTLGAVGYLTKPVNVAQILGVLDQQLERLETRFG